jgi:hypothetical protein
MPDDPTVAERAVVVQLLDRNRAATSAELYAAVSVGTQADVDAAVVRLTETGVIRQAPDGALSAAPALEHLDTLGLICV